MGQSQWHRSISDDVCSHIYYHSLWVPATLSSITITIMMITIMIILILMSAVTFDNDNDNNDTDEDNYNYANLSSHIYYHSLWVPATLSSVTMMMSAVTCATIN